MNILLEPTNIKSIYDTFKGHSKEKHDMILEPFQVMTQLALLSFSPIGTKISISSNSNRIYSKINNKVNIIL